MEFEASEEWLGRVLATLPEFVLVVDRDGVIRYINRVEPDYDREEVVGRGGWTFLFPDGAEEFDAALERVLEEGETDRFEVEASRLDGSTGWYRGETSPLRKDGRIVGAVIVATDITEQKEAEEALARVRRLLPVCAWCDRIRTEEGTWESMEGYLERVEDADVSHGVCPECERRMREGVMNGDETDGNAA